MTKLYSSYSAALYSNNDSCPFRAFTVSGFLSVELSPKVTPARDENSVNVSGAFSGIFYIGIVSTVNRQYLSLFACGQMLFHLWLFAVQSHKRLHSVTLFSSQTGHPYFRAESSENIDGLRYYGFVCSKSATVWYLQFHFKPKKLRTCIRDNVYTSLFPNNSLTHLNNFR